MMIDSFDSDIVIRFASYLQSNDILSLSFTCQTFSSMFNQDGGNTAARQIVSHASKDEIDALPKLADQTYMELYSELEQYRGPRVFDQIIGKSMIHYVNGDKSQIKFEIDENLTHLRQGYADAITSAYCNHIMRAGRHYVTFTIVQRRYAGICVGIVRPLMNWELEGLESFDPGQPRLFPEDWYDEYEYEWNGSIKCCLLTVGATVKKCWWHDWEEDYGVDDWEGSEGFHIGDEVGMLLDLEDGTLSVYRNGRRLGVMKDGLSGEYCWVSTLCHNGDSVRIEKGSIPTV